MMEMVNELKDTQYVNPHYLWDIPKKTHNKDMYDNGELTEEDSR